MRRLRWVSCSALLPFLLVVFFFRCTSVFAETEGIFEEEEIYDPWEPANRNIFEFNDGFDIHLMEPVARGYDYVLPRVVKTAVGNVFDNLSYPSYLVSDLVQFKFGQALEHTGRFLLNSTIGLAGLIDVAEDVGLEEHTEDFGVALAYHGVPAGPYLMIPFVGPTTIRDGVGMIVDLALDPLFWLGSFPGISQQTGRIIAYSEVALEMVHIRAGLLDAVEAGKESSLDYYLFLQSTYYQYRRNLLWDGKPPNAEFFDDDFDFDQSDDFDSDF